MSFQSSNHQFENKEREIFGQSNSDPCNDFFQYLDFDSAEAAEGPKSDLPHLVSTTRASNTAGTSTFMDDLEARKIDLILQPWLGESADEHSTESFYDQLPTDASFYSEQSGRAAISDSELLSLEGISLSSPKLPSLPSSPLQSATKSARRRDRILSSVSKTFKRGGHRGSQDTLRAPVGKSDESPVMMSSSRYSQDWESRMALDANKFDFGFPEPSHGLPSGLPMSPPPSARVSDASSTGTGMLFKTEAHSDEFYTPHQFPNGINNYTPLTTPIAADGHVEMRDIQAHSDSQYPSTPLQSPWEPSSSTGEFNDFRGSSSFAENEATPLWWNHATTAEVAHPAPTVYHNDSRNANESLAMQLQNDLTYNNTLNLNRNHSGVPTGLMIQMPESPNRQSYVIEASPRTQQGFFVPPQYEKNNNPFNSNVNNPNSSRQRRRPHIRPSSPSNTSPSPKCHSHSRSWSHSAATQKSPRTKSSRERSGRTPSRKSSSNNIGAARSQSMQSPVVDFVNYTPSDSMRILTGVAPSGSSKTKARREKEANDKRRKLSMAAMRAVRAAGGDVESLVEEGLFV